MGELKANHQIFGRSIAFPVRSHENFAQFAQILSVLLDDKELIRVRAPVWAYGHGFSAVNQLGAAFAKALPAPADIVRGCATGRSVPALHWLNRITVAHCLAIDDGQSYRLGEGGSGSGEI